MMAPNLDRLLTDPELSSYRESLLEQLFCVELIEACWLSGLGVVEIAHSLVDFRGYDLIATCNGVIRHLQLKGAAGAKTPRLAVHRSLEDVPAGCLVLIKPAVSGERISMSYRFCGDSANEGAPGPFTIDASWTKAKNSRSSIGDDGIPYKADRKNHVYVPMGALEPIKGAETKAELVTRLFGRPRGITL